jgi:endo-1,4-beta-D-glucanase Y
MELIKYNDYLLSNPSYIIIHCFQMFNFGYSEHRY